MHDRMLRLPASHLQRAAERRLCVLVTSTLAFCWPARADSFDTFRSVSTILPSSASAGPPTESRLIVLATESAPLATSSAEVSPQTGLSSSYVPLAPLRCTTAGAPKLICTHSLPLRNVGAIVGGILAGVLLCVLCACALLWLTRRRDRNAAEAADGSEASSSDSTHYIKRRDMAQAPEALAVAPPPPLQSWSFPHPADLPAPPPVVDLAPLPPSIAIPAPAVVASTSGAQPKPVRKRRSSSSVSLPLQPPPSHPPPPAPPLPTPRPARNASTTLSLQGIPNSPDPFRNYQTVSVVDHVGGGADDPVRRSTSGSAASSEGRRRGSRVGSVGGRSSDGGHGAPVGSVGQAL